MKLAMACVALPMLASCALLCPCMTPGGSKGGGGSQGGSNDPGSPGYDASGRTIVFEAGSRAGNIENSWSYQVDLSGDGAWTATQGTSGSQALVASGSIPPSQVSALVQLATTSPGAGEPSFMNLVATPSLPIGDVGGRWLVVTLDQTSHEVIQSDAPAFDELFSAIASETVDPGLLVGMPILTPPGQAFAITPGATFSVVLQGLFDGGYLWTLEPGYDPGVVDLSATSSVSPATGSAPGVSGDQVFDFTASATGSTTLDFEAIRPWEATASAAASASFGVTVR